MRAWREAANSWRRAPLLGVLGVATIAFSLFSLGLFGLVAVNIREALAAVESRVEVRAFVSDSADDAAVLDDASAIRRMPQVASVTYVTPQEALERARREMGEFRDVFDAAVLPASLEIRLREGQRDPTSVEAVAKRVREIPYVEDVRYGEEWVRKLSRIRSVAAATSLEKNVVRTTSRLTTLCASQVRSSASAPPATPLTMPSSRKGRRTNQSVAPTRRMIWISFARASTDMRTVALTMITAAVANSRPSATANTRRRAGAIHDRCATIMAHVTAPPAKPERRLGSDHPSMNAITGNARPITWTARM
jgi:hypothetical protein